MGEHAVYICGSGDAQAEISLTPRYISNGAFYIVWMVRRCMPYQLRAVMPRSPYWQVGEVCQRVGAQGDQHSAGGAVASRERGWRQCARRTGVIARSND
jgi:hypothetical protein